MDARSLGQRIKEARLSKKMTQSEVVGTFITRNMLSQIESGNAVPSMKTLNYLAGVLEISPALLLEEENEKAGETLPPEKLLDEISESTPAAAYLHAKQLFADGADEEALPLLFSLCKEGAFTDEATALYAKGSLRMAKKCTENGNLVQALDYAKEAEGYFSVGLFASPAEKSESLLLLSKIAANLAAAGT